MTRRLPARSFSPRAASAASTPSSRLGCHLFVVLLVALVLVPAAAERAAAAPPDALAAEERIGRLIRELGAEQFLVRERAQAELERVGVSAFDALDDAKDSEDVEVALRVRYLLRILSANWAQEEDPPEVKIVLKGYGEQLDTERKTRMERLSAYGHLRAQSALCRLARFETNPTLSKEAALLVMNATPPADPGARKALAETVRLVVGNSRRTAAQWLRQYGQTLEAPESTLDAWQRTVAAEFLEFDLLSPKTSPTVVRDLLRWNCDYLRGLRRDADAEAVARRLVSTVDGTPAELSELVGWLMERKYWRLVQQLAERFPAEFELSAALIYRRAEAFAQQGDAPQGESLAERAFQTLPDTAAPHLEMALELRDRGLFAWSEREFRRVLALASIGDQEDLNARYRLAEMLFDLERPLDAAKTWQELVDRLDSDPMVRERFGERKQFFRSRMHYFHAHYHVARGELDQARNHLDQGIRNDPHDADVLIAMHRLPKADDEWRKRTSALVADSAAHFLDLIQKWEFIIEQAQSPDAREESLENLANCCNQYAWLVANTEGDFDEAVRLSHRSIELMPKTASYLDTLGHCYFAKRDFANAVKYQAQAARREAHTRQIHRQLKVFQQALAEGQP